MTDYVRYRAGVEQVPDDEAETIAKIAQSFTSEIDAVVKKEGHAMRGSHAKATGYAVGELVVESGLPTELAQGLFATAGTYEALVRFAQGPGELLDDSVSTHRGMAIRLLGLDGETIPESDQPGIQDWLLSTGPNFIHSTAKTFQLDFTAGVSKAPALPQAVKSAVSAVSRVAQAGLKAVGMSSDMLGFFGHPAKHPLADTYFSQAPIRWGDHIAKIAMVPSWGTLAAVGEDTLDTSRPNVFRERMVETFAAEGPAFDLRVQLCTDLDDMPVENAATEWSQDVSPYRTVARLTLPPQNAYGEARRRFFDEGLGFTPAHALAAHRPLGGIMRARIATYRQLANHRRRINGATPIAPRSPSEVPA